MMKRKQTSYAFLMEMIWVCAFFLVCSCIFILAFVKADRMSHQADVLNQAVLAASNAMEQTFSAETSIDLTPYTTEDYRLTMETFEDNGLLSVTIHVLDVQSDHVIYTLTGAHALQEGGSQ